MEGLQIIKQQEVLGKEFTIYGTIEIPLFLAKDVATWIEYSESNVSKLVGMVDEDEKVRNIVTTLGGNQESWFVTEDGLYEILMQSRKPIAKEFKKEVKKILKQIRLTGGYVGSDDLFIQTYLPFADEQTSLLFKQTLSVVRELNTKIKEQEKELIHKEDVIIGLVGDITLAEKRQRINQIVRKTNNKHNISSRFTLLYKEFERKFHCNLNRRMESESTQNIKPKVRSKIDYIDRVMDMTPELYEIACKLFENDVEELKKEWDLTCD